MLELREHQLEVVEKLRQGFKDGHRCQLLYAPTGFGKTEVAMSIMKAVSDKFNRTAMVLDRIVLVEQTSLRMGKYGIEHGVMQSGHWRHRPMERIQICSAQTLEKRQSFPDIDLLIIDECHVQRKKTIEFIQNNPNIKVIGLTATPFTKGLGDVYTHVVGASSTGELIDKGWLAPLKVYIAKEIDMTGAKKVAGEWSQDEVSTRGMKITGDIVSEWVKKTHEVFGAPRKTVVFCSGVEHGRDLVRKFEEAGYNFKSISYKEDDQFKKDTIEDFSKPDTEIHGLIATDILTRGFDVPDVMIGVSARPFSKSFSSHVQQLGRIMRTYDGKEFGVWLDHSGNYLRFRDDWDELYDEGVKRLKEGGERAKKEPKEREKKEAKCPKCGVLWTFPDDKCGECGHIRTKMKNIMAIPGEMMELATANQKLSISKQEFYSQVLYYARSKGFNDGWASHKYKEKFGVWPKNMRQDASTPSPETLKWIKSRFIAWSKSKAKA
jgi:DNA repair protein RadD